MLTLAVNFVNTVNQENTDKCTGIGVETVMHFILIYFISLSFFLIKIPVSVLFSVTDVILANKFCC